MYENQTREIILQRLISLVDPSLDTREGSVIHDMMSPASIEMETLYMVVDTMLDMMFAETSSGIYLDLKVAEVGLVRKPSVQATGTVELTGTPNLFIPAGTQIATLGDDPTYFNTKIDVTLDASGNGSVPVVCDIGGSFANIEAGQISYVVGNLGSVVTPANATAFTGGVDEESDADLLERYYDRIQSPITSGNASNYMEWAKSVSGVGDALVQPLYNGNGTVRILLLNSDKYPADASLCTTVSNYIETVRPIGASVTVLPATGVNINVSCTLTLADGTDKNTVISAFSDSLADYLKSIAFVENTVRYSKISNLLLDISGVIDYSNLTINGTTSNISVPEGSVAIKGVVNLV